MSTGSDEKDGFSWKILSETEPAIDTWSPKKYSVLSSTTFTFTPSGFSGTISFPLEEPTVEIVNFQSYVFHF